MDIADRASELETSQRARALAEAQQKNQSHTPNTSGLCCECGSKISANRLRVKPDAARCIDCQMQQEALGKHFA